MHHTSLTTVKHRLSVGSPLPFNVLDSDQTLLLARGQTVLSRDQLDALMERGALVDLADLQSAREKAV